MMLLQIFTCTCNEYIAELHVHAAIFQTTSSSTSRQIMDSSLGNTGCSDSIFPASSTVPASLLSFAALFVRRDVTRLERLFFLQYPLCTRRMDVRVSLSVLRNNESEKLLKRDVTCSAIDNKNFHYFVQKCKFRGNIESRSFQNVILIACYKNTRSSDNSVTRPQVLEPITCKKSF